MDNILSADELENYESDSDDMAKIARRKVESLIAKIDDRNDAERP